MKKHLFGMALLTCLVVIGGVASAQTIDEIQVYDPITGAPASPFAGQAVTVTGSVYVLKGTYNSGTFYIQDTAGSGINFFNNAAGPFALGDVVEVTGTVGAFGGEINIENSSATFISAGPEVEATLIDIGLIDYETVGTLTEVIGEIAVTNINGGSDDFTTFTGTDSLLIFVDSDTGIDLTAVEVGDQYSVTGPVVNFSGLLEMKPRFQADLVENPGGDTVPVIANVNSTNWVIEAGDPLVITANITDDSAIVSANLYYADSDGTTQGAFASVAMTNVGGNSYSGTIPGGHTGSQVDFYVEATDDGAQTVTNPGTAPATFLSAAVGFTTIYEVNTVHPDSSYQGSPLLDSFVNITGVVTAGTGTATGAQSRFVVQEMDVNPATKSYAYGGILVFEGTGTYEYFRGDEVEIGGQIGEFFGLTEMLPFNADAVNLIGFGAQLPEAVVLSTRELADKSLDDGNGILGERWESVWVKTFPAAYLDSLGFGEYNISSTGALNDSLIVDPSTALAYLPATGDVITIESYMTFSGGDYRIVPYDDSLITLTGLSAVEDVQPVQQAGGFRAIYPNPFNPTTAIKFVVNVDNLVQLNVYNIRGEKVRTLIQDRLSANEYSFVFDGMNDAGQTLASGAYFARLRIGKEVVQVRQMMLVK
jgi:predicted extracellular nuclease